MKNLILVILFFISIAAKSQFCYADFGFWTDGNGNANFINNSYSENVGDSITEQLWIFGDGTESTLISPVHHYLYPGIYTVCHIIETNMGCIDTTCIDIDIQFCYLQITPVIVHVTTNGGNNGKIILNVQYGVPPYHFYWSNGDSTQIITQLTAGTYSVTVCDGLYCCDSATYTVIEPIDTSMFEVQGYVYAGQNLLPQGIVIIYQQKPDSSFKALKYSLIQDGNYSIYPNIEGNFLIYAIPYINVEYPYTPVYFPTYYGNSIYWQQASRILVDSKINDLNINLSSNNTMIWGVGSISGKILYSYIGSYESSIYGADWFDSFSSGTKLNTAKNIPVILMNENNIPLLYTLSDENGNFSFQNLENGTYQIYTEKAGFLTEDIFVTIDSANSDISDINIVISYKKIFLNSLILDQDNNNIIKIYPNPVDDKLIIEFNTNENMEFEVSIFNSLGQNILLDKINSDNVLYYDFSETDPGIYSIIFKHQTQSFYKKFIVR